MSSFTMHVEVSVALNFVISYLYNKLPRRRVDCFGEELEKALKGKFAGHWYPDKPFKGSAFRCIRVTGEQMDPVMELASTASGLDIEEVKDYLPKDLTIWIDPNEVSYRIGEKGIVKVLYSEKTMPLREDDLSSDSSADHEVQSVSRGFNPEAQSFKPIDSLSSSLTNLSLSPPGTSPSSWGPSTSPVQPLAQPPMMGPAPPGPGPAVAAAAAAASSSTSPINSFINRGAMSAATFTAATFAQTKFGSTKLKSHAKRPSRLSPTDLGMYLKQRMPAAQWMSPTTTLPISPVAAAPSQLPPQAAAAAQAKLSPLSPRDIQQELLLEQQQQQQQQRLMYLQQQQLQQQLQQQMQQQLQQQQQQAQRQQAQQQQQQRSSSTWASPSLLSPVGGSLSDLYQPATSTSSSTAASLAAGLSDLLGGATTTGRPASPSLSLPSPDATQSLLDSAAAWSSLAQYPNLQHLLVAN